MSKDVIKVLTKLEKFIEDFDIATNDPDYYNEQLVKAIKEKISELKSGK